MLMYLTLQANLIIASESDFAKVYDNPDGHFTLITDIVLSQSDPTASEFKGIFDGANHTITVADNTLVFATV